MSFTIRQDENIVDRTDWPRFLFLFKEAMKAAGWIVAGSGDGNSTFLNGAPGTSRDVITQGGTGANGMNQTSTRSGCSGSWFRLHTPSDAETFKELLFWRGRNAGRGEEWRIEITFDAAGFANTVPTQDVAPEAVNHVTLAGCQTRPDNSSEWGQPGVIGTNYPAHYVIGDVDERYSFFMFSVDDAVNSPMETCFGMDALVGCHASDFDKFAYLMGHLPASTNGHFAQDTGSGQPFWRADGTTQELDQAGGTLSTTGIYVMRGPNWPFINTPEEGAFRQAWIYPYITDGFGVERVTMGRNDDDITARFDSFRLWLDNNNNSLATIPAASRFSKGASYSGMIRLAPVYAEIGGVLYEDEDAKTWCPLHTALLAWPSATLPDLGSGSSSPATTSMQIRDFEAPAAITRTWVNRAFDNVAGKHVVWETVGAADIALGASYPGPGTFDPTEGGSDTESHTVQAILEA